jgi:hypothetical protein
MYSNRRHLNGTGLILAYASLLSTFRGRPRARSVDCRPSRRAVLRTQGSSPYGCQRWGEEKGALLMWLPRTAWGRAQ